MAEIFSSKKKLDGKVAIITGGASGIGEATTRLFATNGIRGVVIADIQEGERVVESIGSNICSYFHCDVTDEEQVKSMVEFTISSYGQLDIMFSNAGRAFLTRPRLSLTSTYPSWIVLIASMCVVDGGFTI
ncbi:oxidoreductase [Lithospermum erythrorhizon]|uniref:Oxidoreductase n=1 Tax=Lithospermum erythrorhizon TaxID=34254 RepID=A0AAV3R032_LITER